MFEVTNQFSKSMVHAFMHRIKFILNKINQKNVKEIQCKTFFWDYDPIKNIASLHSEFKDVVFYAEQFFSEEPKYFIDSYPLTKLDEGDNLEHFTEIEQKIVAELIEMEKAALEIELPKFEHRKCEPNQQTLGEWVASQESLGKEFNDILMTNLNELYESDKKK
jgi:hypothetical protein